ncbi:DUF2272 domain-containing protein [Cellulophaga sp. F20128]|uniref:papain-like cysteine protease family protein n=1 Tax=Cellulophaga sp. F20128 TaxID=2926413 RepID=UPI001FF58A53|nr:DUF2272 domain-containing protein [Cellulophaga sp. F20128]MCK0157364.1 DUF2272 domain-containing protein [Cellulophaga sp. F20128]
MASVQFNFISEGDNNQLEFNNVLIEVTIPIFSYTSKRTEIFRYASSHISFMASQNINTNTYKVNLPLDELSGKTIEDIYGFYLYHFIDILKDDGININDYSFKFNITIKDDTNQIIATREFEGIYYLKSSYSSDFDRRFHQVEYEKYISIYGEANSKKKDALNTQGITNLSNQYNKRVFLINKEAYELFKYLFDSGYPDRDITDKFVLDFIQVLVDLNGDYPQLSSEEFTIGYTQLVDFFKKTEYTVNKEFFDYLKNNFNKLFDFPITIPKIETLEIGGELQIITEDELLKQDLDFYDLFMEYLQINGKSKTIKYNWTLAQDTIINNTINFKFSNEVPLISNNVSGPITIRVKGYDGAILWEKKYNKEDTTLQNLDLKIKKYPSGEIETDSNTGRPKSNKRLRGKVLQNGNKYTLNELTVVIQGKKGEDELFKIIGSAMTDKSGNFSLDYPYGNYQVAQAMVSLMPNSPVDLVINLENNNETISDDFIFLLLIDEEIVVTDKETNEHDDCDCNSKIRAKRLPDQEDLINSDEYTQDIGGACLNLSTPNRTLREYSYNAIVRVSDPEVANYVLQKVKLGRKVQYNLVGDKKIITRKEIDLNNPIRWEDAPDAKENLSLYQSVTVATGHILHYKSVFKADGYSLGDLVYSLPLAPGQKKQIVVFESSHSLTGAESQSISQGESLSAELVSDRFITDQLSGGLNEDVSGRSKAHTSGMSAGIGASASYGGIGASLGVAGGFSNSNSSASQNSSRSISQFFGEKLRQSLQQNAESYRQLNASVVTTVTEGQEYGVTAETIANHNHCHSLTMMYFEVLRHYAIYQELSHVEECVFVPLLMTNFSTENIHKWKDILATNLLPTPSNTYLKAFSYLRRQHPLLRAFDANERIKTDYTRVDFPDGTYADEVISELTGYLKINVHIPRPKTRFDRILSFPIIKTTITTDAGIDVPGTIRQNIKDTVIGAVAPCAAKGPSIKRNTTSTEVLTRGQIFDMFMTLDANYETVPPAQCIRVSFDGSNGINVFNNFVGIVFDGDETPTEMDFFAGMEKEKKLWEAYAKILDMDLEQLFSYFNGNVIADWDRIFNEHIAPQVVSNLIKDSFGSGGARISITPLGDIDLTEQQKYKGGNRILKYYIKDNGIPANKTRKSIEKIKIDFTSPLTGEHHDLFFNYITFNLHSIQINYRSDYHSSTLVNRSLKNDLHDDIENILTPLNSLEKKNPRKEDEYIVNELIEHLNSSLEHYNKVLWRNLDADRRYMLLDGFNIQTYTSTGHKSVMRSLASVVKNELVTITGNSMVFPVASGYRVGRNNMIEEIGDNLFVEKSLFDYYKPITPMPPYRLSVPTRGVFMEAIQGSCDACEMVKENSSQDWDKFRTEDPTSIAPVVTPTPTITEYKPEYKNFATPMVNIQNAPDAPAPAAGLSQLSEILGNPGAFNDITGLAKNQDNAIKTYLSNQENAKAFAEMSKSLATQQHNTQNSQGIADGITQARQAGNITDEDAQNLTRQHLQQQIDGGESVRETAQFDREQNRPSLAQTASEAVSRGQTVQAQRTDADGTHESINVRPSEGAQPINISYQIDRMTQPTMGCWATVATMLMNWKMRRNNTIEEVLTTTGNNLSPAIENYYLDMFINQTGLAASEKNQFIEALGMEAMPSASYTLHQYYNWLSTYGPLWVTIDANSSSGFSPHALLLFGMEGDLNIPNDVTFKFVNPQNGQEQFEFFDDFIEMFEQMVTDNTGSLFLQVVRFRDHLIQQSEGQSISNNTHWNIPSSTVIDYAIQVAHDEFNTWWTGGLLDNNTNGIAKVTEYWLPLKGSVSEAEETAEQTAPTQVAWSAAFISYLFMRAYLHAVVSHFPNSATFNGYSLADYDTFTNITKRVLLRHASSCLDNLGIFKASGNHISYISRSMQLSGNTIALYNPIDEPVQLGDLIVNGRSGASYDIDDTGRITPSSGQSHVDIIVEIVEIDGDKFARLVGGNTTNSSNKVAYKLRPIDLDGKLVQESNVTNIPLDVVNQNIRDNMTAIGSVGYHSITGVPGLINGAGDYERILISETDVLVRYL